MPVFPGERGACPAPPQPRLLRFGRCGSHLKVFLLLQHASIWVKAFKNTYIVSQLRQTHQTPPVHPSLSPERRQKELPSALRLLRLKAHQHKG